MLSFVQLSVHFNSEFAFKLNAEECSSVNKKHDL